MPFPTFWLSLSGTTVLKLVFSKRQLADKSKWRLGNEITLIGF